MTAAASDLAPVEFKAYKNVKIFNLEEAQKMDAEFPERRKFSEVSESDRKARISFGAEVGRTFSSNKMLFEVPFELDGAVEYMWVKDVNGKVVASKKIRYAESFPATLVASVPAGKITVCCKVADAPVEASPPPPTPSTGDEVAPPPPPPPPKKILVWEGSIVAP